MNNDQKRGEFLCELRKNKGLTQKELGDLIHYSDKNISKWERGISFPNNPNVLNELANIFNVSIEEILYGELIASNNETQIRNNFENEFKSNYNKYKKKEKNLLISILIVIILALLLIYLLFIKNSVKVYNVIIDNEKYSEINMTLLITNKVKALNLKKIEIENSDEISKIEIYYLNDNKKISVFSGENKDYYIEERNGYSEYNLDDLVNHKSFIEIVYNNEKVDNYQLIFEEKYINDNIFPKFSKKSTTNKNQIGADNILKTLKAHGFENKDYYYEKVVDNVTFTYNIDTTSFCITIISDNVIENVTNYSKANDIIYEKMQDGTVIENKKLSVTGTKNCNKEKCTTIEDYAKYINFLKK